MTPALTQTGPVVLSQLEVSGAGAVVAGLRVGALRVCDAELGAVAIVQASGPQ